MWKMLLDHVMQLQEPHKGGYTTAQSDMAAVFRY